MKTWKKAGIFCILAVILLSGYGLPAVINAVLDRQVNGNTETVNAETTQLQMSSDLTLTEKFLVMDRTTSSVNLNSAQNMEYETACECLNQELTELFPSAAGDPFSTADFSETQHAIVLCVYEEKSVLLWDFSLEDETGNQIRVLLDDDSGLILSFSYTLAETPNSQNQTDAADLFTIITDETETEPADFLDNLATRYVDYLRASYNLNGMEISYEWARDSVEEWQTDSDSEAGTEQNVNSEAANAAANVSKTDENEDDADTNPENAGTETGGEETNNDSDIDSETGRENNETDAKTSSGTTETGSLWDSSGSSQWMDATSSLWDYDISDNTAVTSDVEENTEEEINEWYTYIHFTKNGEEYVLELGTNRDLLTIHSMAN